MNKKKMFNFIVDLCGDAVKLSQQSVEQSAIEAAFRCFDVAVDALNYAAARKTTDALQQSEAAYAQAQQQYEEADALRKQTAAQKARYEQQEAWKQKLAQLEESCGEQKQKLKQNMDDRVIVRTIGQQMADNLKQLEELVQQRKEQLSATEGMILANQSEIHRLDDVLQNILKQYTQLTTRETGGN